MKCCTTIRSQREASKGLQAVSNKAILSEKDLIKVSQSAISKGKSLPKLMNKLNFRRNTLKRFLIVPTLKPTRIS